MKPKPRIEADAGRLEEALTAAASVRWSYCADWLGVDRHNAMWLDHHADNRLPADAVVAALTRELDTLKAVLATERAKRVHYQALADNLHHAATAVLAATNAEPPTLFQETP